MWKYYREKKEKDVSPGRFFIYSLLTTTDRILSYNSASSRYVVVINIVIVAVVLR